MILVLERNFLPRSLFQTVGAESRHQRLNHPEAIMHKFSIVLTLLALIGTSSLLAACQTTAGVGRDLSNGGNALTNSAEKNAPPGDRH
jgi:entericidin B